MISFSNIYRRFWSPLRIFVRLILVLNGSQKVESTKYSIEYRQSTEYAATLVALLKRIYHLLELPRACYLGAGH